MKPFIVVFCFVLFAAAGWSATIYVPDDHATIQEAIDASVNGDTVIVRAGTYVENIIFSGSEIVVESESGPATTTIDGGVPSNPDYGSTVLFENGETRDTVLEGFTITNGSGTYNQYNYDYDGGGICCRFDSSPTISRCLITGNDCEDHGAGIAALDASSPFIINCNISFNGSANTNGGGGVYCADGFADIDNCTISDNQAGVGGGIVFENGSPSAVGCTIVNNYTDNVGGGVYLNSGDLGTEVTRCLISSNLAENGGGGIWATATDQSLVDANRIQDNTVNNSGIWGGGGICVLNSQTTLVNNLISHNTCPEGGGVTIAFFSSAVMTNNTIVYNTADEGGGLWFYDASATITNTIFWGNTAPTDPQIYTYSGTPSINHSCIEGGWPYGSNNIQDDPLFVDPLGGDFHLTFTSPCANAGDADAPEISDEDIEGDEREAFGGVDIGADEFDYHLYHLGDVIPGATITVRATGWPNMAVNILKGSGFRYPALHTRYGKLYLASPIKSFFMGRTGTDGIVEYTATIPAWWQSGERYFFQAFFGGLGFWSSRLTNLKIVTVE